MNDTSVMKFETSKAGQFGASGTGKRETRDDREIKAKTLLSVSPITFIAQLGKVYGDMLASGRALDVQGVILATARPESLACHICGKVHGKPTKEMVRRGEGWKANRIALLYLVSQSGKPLLVSETCMLEYVLPAMTKANVTNFADVVRVFGKK